MKKLVEKTLEKGRQITFDEANGWYHEGTFINPNDYAFYWTEFEEAAKIALQQLKSEENRKPSNPKEEVTDMSRKKFKPLDEERKEDVLKILTQMYIDNGEKMPTSRDIKKNKDITKEEVDTLRWTHEYTEHIMYKRAREIKNEKEVADMEQKKVAEVIPEAKTTSKEKNSKAKKTKNKPKGKYGYKKYSRLTDEQCISIFRRACEDAGYILTQAEICAATEMGELPSYTTLKKAAGPWYKWDKLFNLPFKSDVVKRMANEALMQEAALSNPDSKRESAELDNLPSAEIPPSEPKAEIPPSEPKADTHPSEPKTDLAKLLTLLAKMDGVKIKGEITITFES